MELRRKSMPVRRPMMATPSGAVFLLGGIIRSLHSPAAPHGWSPDRWFILHTCLAPFALSPWKPRSWRMLCRLGSMSAFTCRWWFVGPGGCVAAVFVLLGGCFATRGYFELGGCFAAVSTLADTLPLWLCFSVDAFLPSPSSWLRQYFVQVLLFRWLLFGRLVWRVPLHASSVVSAAAAVCEFVCAFSLVFLFL